MVLGWVFAAIVTLVCLVIALLLGYAIFRKRESAQPGAVGADTGGVRAVLLGTLISTFILFAMALYALVVLNQTAHPSRPARLVVTVTGYDWWWRASYPATQSSAAFVTANEIHIPVGQPVELKLESADVIHAFWVPLLAGKTQMIPGETNQQWLEADRAGSYLGQCTQFCGAGHARMAVMVVADAPADFERWRNAQARPAMAPAAGLATQGLSLFERQCGGCHAVQGSAANGDHAPDLTHLMSRRKIAAGMLDNTPANLLAWIEHAQQIKLGSRMPDFSFTNEQQQQLMAYLEQLQ